MSDTERFQAARNTLRLCVIVFGIGAISVPLDTARYGFSPLGAGALLHAMEAVAIGIWLWRTGNRCSPRAHDLLYALLLAPYLITIWLPQIYEHHRGTLVEPLLAHHFLLLGIAILPPYHFRWGVGLLVLFAAHGIALWAVLEEHALSPTLDREPWFTLLFAGIALGMLWMRSRRRELELRLARAESRAEALDRLNRVLLGLRDRANTPLQTLEVALSLLELRDDGADPVRASMRRAVADLIAAQQPLADAAPASQLSIDLERELRELRSGEP